MLRFHVVADESVSPNLYRQAWDCLIARLGRDRITAVAILTPEDDHIAYGGLITEFCRVCKLAAIQVAFHGQTVHLAAKTNPLEGPLCDAPPGTRIRSAIRSCEAATMGRDNIAIVAIYRLADIADGLHERGITLDTTNILPGLVVVDETTAGRQQAEITIINPAQR